MSGGVLIDVDGLYADGLPFMFSLGSVTLFLTVLLSFLPLGLVPA